MKRPSWYIHIPVVVAVVVAVALGGCSDAGTDDATGDSADAPTPAASLPFTVEAVESRNLSADGKIGIAVTNTGTEPVTIDQVALTAPPFPESSMVPRSALDPGRTVWYGVPEPEPECESLAAFPNRTPPDDAYVVDITVGDRTTTMRAGRPEVYRRLGERACGVENVLSVVDVMFGPPAAGGTGGAATVDTTIDLVRRPGTAQVVTITAVRGTPQFALTGTGDGPLIRLGPADTTVSAPVTVVPLRCDAHVLAEGKKNYTFSVFVSVDDAAEALVEIPAPDDLRAALVDACDVH